MREERKMRSSNWKAILALFLAAIMILSVLLTIISSLF